MSLIQIIITLAAFDAGVDPGVLSAICWVESRHRPHVTNFNDGNGRNSHGLCQIQTRTARSEGFNGDVKLLYVPEVNAYYAGLYFKRQLKRYKGNVDKAISAYNMGTARQRCDINTKQCGFLNQEYVDKVKKALEEGR